VAALRGCDTVIYDTHFVPDEYARFPHYGHSTPDHALELLAGNDVRRLILYHHAPSHDDDQMDKIAAEYLAQGRGGRHRRDHRVRGHGAHRGRGARRAA
jgi:ribonuclease BN (tRNA processing enzyme)